MDGFPPPAQVNKQIGLLLLVLVLGIGVGAGGYAFVSRYRAATPPSTASTQSSATTPTTSAESTTTASSATTPASNHFDPLTAKAGDKIGALTVSAFEPFEKFDMGDYELIAGSARFDGEVTLTGTYRNIPKDFAELDDTVCMTIRDPLSIDQLPNFVQNNDSPNPTFCFENNDEAKQQFTPDGSQGTATVVIDQYTIKSGIGLVNSAHLVRIISK